MKEPGAPGASLQTGTSLGTNMKLKLITLAACAVLAAPALAADPSATLNRGWIEYAGSQAVGNNKVQDDKNAYWIFEGAGTWMGQAVNSWFVFWDPRSSLPLKGSIDFDNKILFVHDDQSGLKATEGFNKTGLGYDYSAKLVGLEEADAKHTSWAGNTLTLKWNASNPGDHIRVMTAVPEPASYAMFGAGLLALGFMARRRRAD
jgi:hypothetical protein